MIEEYIKNKINLQLIIAEKLSNSFLSEAQDSAYLIIDHILERIGMSVYYEENISNKPSLRAKDKDVILEKIKREPFNTKLDVLFKKLGNRFKQKILNLHEVRNHIQHRYITINFSVDKKIVKSYLQCVKDILNKLGWFKPEIGAFNILIEKETVSKEDQAEFDEILDLIGYVSVTESSLSKTLS